MRTDFCRVASFLLILAVFTGCISNKKIIYLQNLPGKPEIEEETLVTYDLPIYRIQKDDILDVQVRSTNVEVNEIFNLASGMAGAGGQMGVGGFMGGGGGDVYYMTGYTVDKTGMIELPFVGKLSVEGLNTDEIKELVEKNLMQYFQDEIFVRVKLGGIRYAAFGEFRMAGNFVVLQNRLTIFEAIANAGDLNIMAKRDEILVLRQYPEGTKLHRVNLKDRNIISSPFYFIQPNDQLYAEPIKAREIGGGETGVQTFQLFMTLLSAGLFIYAIFLND
ncbi:polysaccharide biosynthesis/export family protein [Litoribacter alkaliphilus]|uniref:Polysaccharide biosynthesis/export family protein n=1 Tax=Litoribacter ruber TaxID=702568 RepID=A0AAP2CJZ2_9BACT|nr:polysaccharide biosynthesis/export family protein [Litoribacter alkaliphilus]MBS9523182.1 polysaccharide biosynthesis/export family protein [Litoribacter alkaliphilus]